MSAEEKLRGKSAGKPESEITKLKGIWRKLADDAREYWRQLFASDTAQPEIRRQLLAKLKVDLRYDNQLNRFRLWDAQQQANDEEAEWAAQEEDDLTAQGLSGEALRTELLDRIKRRALARGDFKLGLAVIKQDINSEAAKLDREKFMRETCALFVKWSADKRASEIANSTATNADKIEQLGQLMFGEDWRK